MLPFLSLCGQEELNVLPRYVPCNGVLFGGQKGLSGQPRLVELLVECQEMVMRTIVSSFQPPGDFDVKGFCNLL